jgi:hypothetical protein
MPSLRLLRTTTHPYLGGAVPAGELVNVPPGVAGELIQWGAAVREQPVETATNERRERAVRPQPERR